MSIPSSIYKLRSERIRFSMTVAGSRWASAQYGQPGRRTGSMSLAGTELCASDLHYYMHGRNSDFLVRSPVLGYPASSGLNGRSSSGGAAKYGPVIGDLPPLGTPISAAGVNSTRASSPSEPSADVAKSPPNEGCSWVTVVCSECKRLKIKGDPKSPCGTCMRRK
ncbi:hypothetical protein FA13DRAFT_592669 [Coprinellus micaceus]|uniref:Uncharacterized protein n=1 Tax=Coprinellus micaceus TaxID=71717 RepID=A0A4Y7SAJ9_COPMI|nr:hypothetical protein FA13DRAFT_592669 [Coprinellus micaceus]